eukprot:278537_1
MDAVSPPQALLQFICDQELFCSLSELKELYTIEDLIHPRPQLFVLYHATNVKYWIEEHCKNPKDNLLSTHLDELLQSFCHLLPQYQPNHIQSVHSASLQKNMTHITNTSYYSVFYKLHQGIKIQSILTSNQPQHLRTKIINDSFKLNQTQSAFNFRHINIQKDIDDNQEIEFEIIDTIEILGSINKKTNKQNQDKIDQFIQSHDFDTFKHELFEYIDSIKAAFCDSMIDLIYSTAAALRSNQRANQQKQDQEEPTQVIQRAPKPIRSPLKPSNNNRKIQKSVHDYFSPQKKKKKVAPTQTKTPQYKTGMKVKIRQKNNGDSNKNHKEEYVWKTAKIIQMTKHRITVTMLDGNHHRVIRDFNKIQPIVELDSDDEMESLMDLVHQSSSEEEDDDVVMMDANENNTNKRPRRKCRNANASVQSANYQRGRRFWEEKEDVAFRAGLVKYKDIIDVKSRGVPGIWSKIKADDDEKGEDRELKHRTTKMLYDRYRWYVKKGNLPKECEKKA